MTRPAAVVAVRVVIGQGAPELRGDDIDRPARPRARPAARRRTGSGAGPHRPPGRSLRPMSVVGLAGVAASFRVADDDPRRQADQHRRGDLARVGAGQLVMDVLGPDARRRRPTSPGRRGRRPGTRTAGRSTRITPGTRVRAATVTARSPASAGVVCIFQLAAMITSRMGANHARRLRRRRRRPAGPAPARPAAPSVPGPAAPPSDAGPVARRGR